MTEAQIKYLVTRFLGWPLPKNFAPDGGIFYAPRDGHSSVGVMPSGTNLFDAAQAEAMVRYLVDGMPEARANRPVLDRKVDHPVVGSVMHLKSGSPELVVIEPPSDTKVTVAWFDGEKDWHLATFPAACLIMADKSGPAAHCIAASAVLSKLEAMETLLQSLRSDVARQSVRPDAA